MSATTITHCVRIARQVRDNLETDVSDLAVINVGHIPRITLARNERTGDADLKTTLPAAAVFCTLASSEPATIGETATDFDQEYRVQIAVFTPWDPTDAEAWDDAAGIAEAVADTFHLHPMLTSDGVLAEDDEGAVLLRAQYANLESMTQVMYDDRLRMAVWEVVGAVLLVGVEPFDESEAV